MYSSFPQIALGFHGCDRKVGEAVISGQGRLVASVNSYDWLGSGMYFWENAPGRAFQWAEDVKKNPRLSRGGIEEPFVLGAMIDLGHCLNLTDSGYCRLLRQAYELVNDASLKAGESMPQNKGGKKELDCLVINTVMLENQEGGYPQFDTVRGAYIEGEPIYLGAMLYEKTHIQICVRNPNCIKGYFNPLAKDSGFRVP